MKPVSYQIMEVSEENKSKKRKHSDDDAEPSTSTGIKRRKRNLTIKHSDTVPASSLPVSRFVI